jgi:FAD/FMN-containing dehydrogenase
LWALKGGGGNFGIVTSFEFAMHEVGPMANLGLFFFDVEHAAQALRFARAYLHELPDAYGSLVIGMSAPPAPFVPQEHVGKPGYAIAVVNWGSPEEHMTRVQPLRDLHPLFEVITPIPHVALQQMLDEAAPWGAYAYEKALYFDDLSDPVIDLSVAALPDRVSPMTITPIFAAGGEFARVPEHTTGFGGGRSMRWVYNMAAVAPTPALLAAERPWVAALHDALAPHASAGTYVNFLNDKDISRVRMAYGPEKYDRLAAIKKVWDPDNVFHHNANILPMA